MAECLSVDEINVLQSENARLQIELSKRNQMLMEAHSQHKKLTEELVTAQNQYNKVVEQNKELQENLRNLQNGKI